MDSATIDMYAEAALHADKLTAYSGCNQLQRQGVRYLRSGCGSALGSAARYQSPQQTVETPGLQVYQNLMRTSRLFSNHLVHRSLLRKACDYVR